MIKKIVFTLILLGLCFGGYVAWKYFFPEDKVLITRRLDELAQFASISPEDGNFKRMTKMDGIRDFFAEEARIVLMVPEVGRVEVAGKEVIRDYWVQRMPLLQRIGVQFFDLIIELNQGKDYATVELTAKIDYADRWGREDYLVQEFKFILKKEEGKWVISRLENPATFE